LKSEQIRSLNATQLGHVAGAMPTNTFTTSAGWNCQSTGPCWETTSCTQ
jgi:hypothetical protein